MSGGILYKLIIHLHFSSRDPEQSPPNARLGTSRQRLSGQRPARARFLLGTNRAISTRGLERNYRFIN